MSLPAALAFLCALFLLPFVALAAYWRRNPRAIVWWAIGAVSVAGSVSTVAVVIAPAPTPPNGIARDPADAGAPVPQCVPAPPVEPHSAVAAESVPLAGTLAGVGDTIAVEAQPE